MPTVTDAFAENLLADRRQAGLSQEELGLRSGLDDNRALERGVASPKLESRGCWTRTRPSCVAELQS